ncbi:hypothetical protein [Dongia sedimenti]|uniref:Uncharacterized protein n=1 Tax=Dongia sedimenti TaxID=3064282 RepID=A0ABU0YW95_9PROT|nr:hypothetical protein [Rhodospirillaceae bacterium R-7]
MRGSVAAFGGVLVCAIAALIGLAPAEAKNVNEFTVGQWGGYSYTDDSNGQFVDCEIWTPANGDQVQFGIAIPKDYSLELWLYSKPWSLPANQSYPISYWVDRNQQYRGRAETYDQYNVLIKVESDQAVYDELKAGNEVTFRTQNQDYVFDLSGSRAALSRLLNCVDQYSKTASTNPFGGGDSGSQQGSDNNQQQSSSGGGNEQDSASSPKLKALTRSTDQVRQFLVDVTGAKPSMISIDTKANKAGYPYYAFSTPIGAGQFWQEYLGNDTLRDIVAGYLSGYKEECKGEFAQDIKDPVQGEHGQMAFGTATCSSSPYQDNGAEVLSYALTASDNVISVYVSYVGGNAAKAKTDALGKLIARRQEAEVQ